MNWILVSRARFLILVIGISVLLACVVARLYYWQVSSGSKMAAEAKKNREGDGGDGIAKGRRGDIRDRHGSLLATSRALITLGCDPTAIDLVQLAAKPLDKEGNPTGKPPLQEQLAEILRMKVPELLLSLQRKTYLTAKGPKDVQWRVVKADLSQADFDKANSLKIKGICNNPRYERIYPQQGLACHVLGFVNKGQTPSSGVESYLDYYLKGVDGWVESNYDAVRREIFHYREREVAARPGFNVELTLDSVVQSLVEEEVAALVTKFSPKGVSIIVSDPTNAEILGLANYPNYNPNKFWEPDALLIAKYSDVATYPKNDSPAKIREMALGEAQKNRAVTDVYEPGSTFKIVAISAALETGVIAPNSIWDCSQTTISYKGRNLKLPGDAGHHYDKLTLEQVIAKSSNRGTVLVGCRFAEQLGEQRLYDFVRAFGFGEATPFGFGGEVRGLLRSPDKWDSNTIACVPMGHSISATPMQVHTAMGVIASGGLLLSPHVIRRVADQDGNTVLENVSAPRHRVISASTASTMASMLRKVIEPGGTATRAEIKGYEPVGKTGTTEKIVNGHYSRAHHVASFSGFFPASAPRLLITVIVDEPQGADFGGTVAAPAFKSISEKLIPYLKIPPMPGSEPGIHIAKDR